MPEPLLTVEEFIDMFGEVDTPSKTTQLKRPLGVALRRIKAWVGDAVYAAAAEAGEDDEIRNDLQFAAGYLAMHFLIANFNTVVRAGGIVKTEKTEGNTVMAYLEPDQTAKRAQEFFDLADEAATPYKLATTASTVETVIDEECFDERRSAYTRTTC